MNEAPPPTTPFTAESVTIVGVGLIGGSLAAALRRKGYRGEIVGVGRNAARLKAACDRGLIDRGATDVAEAAGRSSFIVFCTPVDRIAADVQEAARHCQAGTLLTDAGSVKGPICRDLHGKLPAGISFIGSHPLAGSEKQGFEHARGDLFEGRVCVVTPDADSPREPLERLVEFWKGLGARVVAMSPEEHDIAVATTSHSPHVVASALAKALPEGFRPLAAAGFRDTTRIAAGDPDLWVAILRQNRTAVVAALESVSMTLSDFQKAIAEDDVPTLRQLLQLGKTVRDSLRDDRVAESK